MRGAFQLLLAFAALLGAAPAAAAPRGEVVGFYVPWDPQAKSSLAANLDAVTVFAPQWVNLDAAGGLHIVPDDPGQAILAAARRPPKVMPLVTNAHDAQWDAKAADAVLLTPAVQAAFIADLAAAADAHGFAGYVLDFENLSPAGEAAYPALAANLRAVLAPKRKVVWVTTPLLAPVATQQALARAADRTVLMAYDECWATSTPGPIAGLDWLKAGLAARRGVLAPGRTVLALGSYAYDWPSGAAAKVVSVPAALELARAHGVAVVRERASQNVGFAYADDSGVAHQVWLADAPAFAAAKTAIAQAGFRSWGVWRLGLEDPGLWRSAAGQAAGGSAVQSPPFDCEPLPR